MKEFAQDLSKRETAFIVVIVLLVALTGYFAWQISKEQKSAITNFAECVAAGNPIMESYPEQCAADGKVFTNPDQEPVTPPGNDVSETLEWTNYTSAKNSYTVKIPDGWKLVTVGDLEGLYGGKFADLTYVPGLRGSVEVTEGGWDGVSVFSLYISGASRAQRLGEKQGEITTAQGAIAEKYYYEEMSNPEGTEGYTKGQKVVTYYFGEAGKYAEVQHVYGNGELDQTEVVEMMLGTLLVN